MCMMDWRIGRLIRAVVHEPTSNGSALIIPANQQRVAVTWSLDTLNAIDFTSRALLECDAKFFAELNASSPNYTVSLLTHGELPTRRLGVENGTFQESVGIIEYFMPEEYLTAGLEQFYSEYNQWKRQS